ncbi:hypothetical protein AB0M29_13750 [Streptomyces sp. NPDC051976]|uniref:hypothetical protein n=1 Tax=Streptomyces sp. NPDC051976 TaxID=3154947 RepID=UPI003446C54B
MSGTDSTTALRAPEIDTLEVDEIAIEELAEVGASTGNCFGTAGTMSCPGTAGTWGCFT